VPDKLPKILTEEETHALLSPPNQRYFGSYWDYLYMRLMLKAGLRASKATSLRKEHVDLMSGKLSVREGKGAKDRYIPLPQSTLRWLREYWVTHRHPQFCFPLTAGITGEPLIRRASPRRPQQ